MELKILGSSSAGNCYILSDEKEALLIECGVRFDLIKKALNFQLRKVVGCLLTHEDGDHCKSVNDVLKAGITVAASKGTLEAVGQSNHHRAYVMKSGDLATFGNFRVRCFDIKHDVAEPLGFLINHPSTGNTLFLTDSYYSEYQFPNLNNILIEANYCEKIINTRLLNKQIDKSLRSRIVRSHMSLATCKKTLQANDLSKVNNIVLIHLSDGNSDEARFKKEVQEATGKVVYIASDGMTIPFNKQPF